MGEGSRVYSSFEARTKTVKFWWSNPYGAMCAEQGNAKQCNAMQSDANQCETMQGTAVQLNALQEYAM
eukprot:7008545-Pyramimonas_sp.AAC.1